MNKTRIAFIASLIFIAIFFCVYYYFCLCRSDIQKNGDLQDRTSIVIEKKESDISKVCFSEKCFNVEIADTPKEHTVGLMNREYLNPDNGMLFIFDVENRYCFWMKNTLIPLDIIWLDKNQNVIFIKHNAKPCETDPCETFSPNKNAKYVLEINSGLAKEIELEEGDYLEFKPQN